jgi:hypothetical protein
VARILALQSAHYARAYGELPLPNLFELLKITAISRKVIAPDVGGGFGPKGGHYPEELVAAVVSEKLGRPVKWTQNALLSHP